MTGLQTYNKQWAIAKTFCSPLSTFMYSVLQLTSGSYRLPHIIAPTHAHTYIHTPKPLHVHPFSVRVLPTLLISCKIGCGTRLEGNIEEECDTVIKKSETMQISPFNPENMHSECFVDLTVPRPFSINKRPCFDTKRWNESYEPAIRFKSLDSYYPRVFWLSQGHRSQKHNTDSHRLQYV